MIELITNKTEPIQPKTLRMCEMKPLQVCVVVEEDSCYKGAVVMRTQSECAREVMRLNSPKPGDGWSGSSNLLVRELYPGETYTLKLS